MAKAATFENALIVAATTNEVRLELERVGVWERVSAFEGIGWPIVELGLGHWITISGIGRANAAGATAWAIAKDSTIARVVNIGIAGVLPGGGLELGEVVVARESVFAEEGVWLPGGWADVEALGFPLGDDDGDEAWAKGNRIQCDGRLSNAIANLIATDDGESTRCGAIATVACCSGTDASAQAIEARTKAVAEAMEGAAVVATARRLGRAATEVRVISNTCGDRAQQIWDMKRALEKVDQVLTSILE